MAKQQIVIEIDEDYYEMIKEWFDSGVGLGTGSIAIAKGTPLPKKHGRLVAEPTEKDIGETILGLSDFADCIRDAVREVFRNAPTIIEGSES